MKILVTGGAGFIGSHVVDEYINLEHEVVIIDNLSTGKKENLNPKAKFYKVDIRSDKVDEIFRKEKPEIVNHHAAQISVRTSVENPVLDADCNILGTLKLLENSIKYKVRKFIFISTGGAIYGDTEEYPTSENATPSPLSPYGISKLTCEKYLYFYKLINNLDFTVLRYSNVYGPRQIPHGEAGAISIFIENILSNKISKLYHYDDDKEGEGMERDYCYVKDVVASNVLALNKGSGEVINIGTGIPTKTSKIYDLIYKNISSRVKITNCALKKPVRAGPRIGDLKKSCLNIDKAKKILGWEPKYSLETGIKETVEWFVARDFERSEKMADKS